MLRARPPPLQTQRPTPPGGAPLTQWRTCPRRLPHPTPHCRRGGSTAGPEPEAPRLAYRAAARAVVVPHPASPTRTPYPPSPPPPLRVAAPSLRSSEAWTVAQVASKQSGHCSGHSLRFVIVLLVLAAGDDGAPLCPLRLGQPSASGWSGGQAVALAGRRGMPGVRHPQGARSGPLMARQPRGLAGQGRGGLCGGGGGGGGGGVGCAAPGGARSRPAGVAPPCWSRRPGSPGAISSTGDPSPG